MSSRPSTPRGCDEVGERTLLLSVKPRYTDKLLSGEKTIELRRIRPKIEPGDVILLYATAPVFQVVGICHVSKILLGSPEAMWSRVGRGAAISRTEYDRYFNGAARAIGIVVERPARLAECLSLGELRKHAPGFMPPQSYRYLSGLQRALRELLVGAAREVTFNSA